MLCKDACMDGERLICRTSCEWNMINRELFTGKIILLLRIVLVIQQC